MTTVFRYLKWDGTQAEQELGAEEFFNEFTDYLMEGWTPDEAYEWILKQGVQGSQVKVMGIDELRSEVAEYRRTLFDSYNIKHALSEMKERLNEMIEKELGADADSDADGSPESRERNSLLKNLPGKLSAALETLAEYEFSDDESRSQFESLSSRLEDIKKAERFIKMYGERFSGEQDLDFEELLELIEKMDELDRFEKNLMSGNFEQIEPGELEDVLSGSGHDSIILLKGFKSTLEKSGLIKASGGRTELTPKGIRKLGETALNDIFSTLKRDKLAEHETTHRGSGSAKPEETKAYEFGDPFNLNIVNTLKNSLVRESEGSRIKMEPGDFEVYDMEYQTHAATALLLDLSWSMSFQGRFPAAKRVALALDHLIRTKYPKDDFNIIGFSTGARVLSTKELTVTTWDSNDPFTNIQHALSVAAKTISRHKSTNKQIILITDGQPTAYYLDGYLQVELPMFFGGLSPRATFETLKEVKRITGMGIRINTFMLDDSPSLRRFVEEMTRINKGRAFFTTPDKLGKYLLVDYLKRKRKML